MFSLFRQTDRRADRWITVKQYAPDLSVRGHKYMSLKNCNLDMERVENVVVKGENASNQHFLPFPQCFQKASFTWMLKVVIVW